MKTSVFVLSVFLMTVTILARDCFEIRLNDGSVISGVYVEYDEIFGEKYVVYSYRNDAGPRRLPMNRVKEIVPAACQDGIPKPTPMALSGGSSSESNSGDPSSNWTKAVEIITDGNDIRRKKRWADEIKGRYVRVCGAMQDVEAGKVKHRVRVIVKTGLKDPEFMYVTANVASGREQLLTEMNIDDAICITGKITDSRHIGTRRADDTDEFLLELEKLMDPTKMMVDIVIDDCRIERGFESDKPVLPENDPETTPRLVI